MTKGINLLPWRVQEREEKKLQFYVNMGISVFMAIACIMGIHMMMARQITTQRNTNNYLQQEITKFDKQIEEIKNLKKQKELLLKRLNIIHELEANRPHIVKFFDSFARVVPEGIYVKSIVRKGDQLTLTGKAESNTRIATLMRNLDASLIFKNVVLSEIKTDEKDQSYSRNFTLQFTQAKPEVTQK